MTATELTFTSDGYTLAGTLLAPSSTPSGATRHPAAVLISGSGPIDRNSNMKRQKLNVMRDVAEHLAAAGIASLRYDKRGVSASEGDYRSTGLHDNIADAAAAVAMLLSRPEIDPSRVVVVGHSEGAMIATDLAAQPTGISGAVLLSGPAQTGEEVLRWQAAQIAPTIPAPVKAILRLLRKDILTMQDKRIAKLKESEGDVVRINLVRMNARWFREFLAYDPTPALRKAAVPILAITGVKDIQVDPDDVAVMAELVPTSFTGHVLEDVTHLLRRDDGPPGLKSYRKQMKRPVDPNLLEMASRWINGLGAETKEIT